MSKLHVNDDPRFEALLAAVQKFHDDQEDNADQMKVKRIVMMLAPGAVNPCTGNKCAAQGKRPEIHINPQTGAVTCRCVD